jgi:hypothetical protein
MEGDRVERKLAVILSADIHGYSRLMGQDEAGTLRTLKAYRELTDTLIKQHHARFAAYEEQLMREVRGIPEEYLPNLIQIVRLFRESVELKPAAASFRQGWKETLAGETRPISELWKDIDAK